MKILFILFKSVILVLFTYFLLKCWISIDTFLNIYLWVLQYSHKMNLSFIHLKNQMDMDAYEYWNPHNFREIAHKHSFML